MNVYRSRQMIIQQGA